MGWGVADRSRGGRVNTTGGNLWKYRMKKNYTIQEMADLLGIPKRTYESYELRETGTAKRIDRILEVIG